MEGSLCPRGAAGISLLYDSQRLQSPMIRTGERGSGSWRKATWDEALDQVGRQAQGDHQQARGAQRGPGRAHPAGHPREQDLSQGHRVAQPLHPRRPVQGVGQHGLPVAVRLHRRPDGHRLQEHAAHRALRPQHLRGHFGQGGQQPDGGPGKRRQADLHRPAGDGDRHQGPPLLDDPPRHRSGPQLRPDPRHSEGTALRRRIRGPLGVGPGRTPGFRPRLHPRVGREGNRHRGRRNRGAGPRDQQGQARR